jgi:hypothetical protein
MVAISTNWAPGVDHQLSIASGANLAAPDPKRSVTLQYGSAICCRSVKVLAHRVRVAHVEHFASQEASVPQWLGLRKLNRGLLGGWRLMRPRKLWLKK